MATGINRWALVVLALCLAVAAVTIAAPGASARASNEPLELTFDKSFDPAETAANGGMVTWSGTVSGDISGALETRLVDLRVSGPIWHVVFDWEIVAGDQTFTARLHGILNTETGAVVMNGTVIEGYLLGAQVHEEGQLIDAGTLRFQGLIRLMPATAS